MAFTPQTWYLISKKLADAWGTVEEQANVLQTNQLSKHYDKGIDEWYKRQTQEMPKFNSLLAKIANKSIDKVNEESVKALKKALELVDAETLKAMREVAGITGDLSETKDEFIASAVQRFSDFNRGQMNVFMHSAMHRNGRFINNVKLMTEMPESGKKRKDIRAEGNLKESTQKLYDAIRKQTEEGIRYGVPITYANGRKMPFKSHMEMSVRTTIQNEASNRMEQATRALGIIFFLASEHADSADDHADYQGKIYVNDNWESVIIDAELKERIRAFIAKNNIRTIQWVKGPPVYFTTRPNCRHYFIPITIEQAFGDIRALKARLKTKKGEYLKENYPDLKRQRYIERSIRYYKERLRTNSILYQNAKDPIAKAKAMADMEKDAYLVRKWQAEQRSLMLKNENLMRDYRREDVNKIVQDLGVELHLKSPKELINEAKNDIIEVSKDNEQHGLINTKTGEVVKTRIGLVHTEHLKHCTEKNGWYVDWPTLAKKPGVKIYGMVCEGGKGFQGLMAITHDKNAQATYLDWIVTAPHNNKQLTGGTQEFKGVGNLFIAKAAQESVKAGFGGFMYGFANNKETLAHYCKKWGARFIGTLHPNHVEWDEKTAQELIRKYKLEDPKK